jgi:hypothetical protein
VGLHNPNDWRYQQKPGNLFNTYLGKAPPPDSPTRGKKRRLPKVRPTPPAPPKEPIDELIAFLQTAATVGQANQFLKRVADSKRVQVQLKEQPWETIRRFAADHMTNLETERYLHELKRRKAAAEPLIRPPFAR